jgi:hypothetical protein
MNRRRPMLSYPPHQTARGKKALWQALFWMLAVYLYPLQARAQDDVAEKVKQLTEAMSRVQAQLNDSQRELEQLRQQLAALQGAAPQASAAPEQSAESDATKLEEQVADLRERQSMQEAQIAVQDQEKVESDSKFPIKISGLILMTGFANTGNVDMAATPTIAIPGSGSSGISLRQTILGIDARGPHVLGARSHGDLRVDFDGTLQSPTAYNGGYGAGLLRLRTAHGVLDWSHTEAFFELDRPLISPNAPSSLVAVAEPPLAWSGDLWNWNPQFGVTQDIPLGSAPLLRAQAALIDVADAPYTTMLGAPSPVGLGLGASTGEASRWPGVETRIAMLGSQADDSTQIGVGGFFAPHHSVIGTRFDSWAGTVDYRFRLPAGMQASGSFYRGQALGGLGGGAYKDFVYVADPDGVGMNGTGYYYRTIDDVGGWTQWKQKISDRLEFNEAIGIDNVPARDLHHYVGPASAVYQNLARNRTVTGNVIYSPSSYFLFSLEYRRIESSYVSGPAAASDVIGLAAGYKF